MKKKKKEKRWQCDAYTIFNLYEIFNGNIDRLSFVTETKAIFEIGTEFLKQSYPFWNLAKIKDLTLCDISVWK